MPFVLRPKVEEDLKRLTQERIILPVEFSDWATHIVPVLKVICEDYQDTLDPVMRVDQYPLPKIIDSLTKLSRGKKLSKIDHTQEYCQMEMAEQQYALCFGYVGQDLVHSLLPNRRDFTRVTWEILHIDSAGSFQKQMFLIFFDNHSKWSEVVQMNSTTASSTANTLKDKFAR